MLINVYKDKIGECKEAIASTEEAKETLIDIICHTYHDIINYGNLTYYNQDNSMYNLNLNKDLRMIISQFEREIGLLEEKGKYSNLVTKEVSEVPNQNIVHIAVNNQNINMISVTLDVVETTINELSNEYLSNSEKDELITMVKELYEQDKGKDNSIYKQKFHEIAKYVCDKSVDALIALAPILFRLVM